MKRLVIVLLAVLVLLILVACAPAQPYQAQEPYVEPVYEPVQEPYVEPLPPPEPIYEPPQQVQIREPFPEVLERDCLGICQDYCALSAQNACVQGSRSLCKSNCGTVIDPSACTQACAFLSQPNVCRQRLQQFCEANCIGRCV